MNSRSVGIFAVVVALIVGGALWYLNSDFAPHVPVSSEPTPVPLLKSPQDVPAGALDERRTPRPLLVPSPAPPPNDTAAVSKPEAPVMTEDDRKIDEILRANPANTDADNIAAAQRLIAVLPTLTAEGQLEGINHINNLLPDEIYNQSIAVFWKNPSFNPDVLEFICSDLLNRDDKVKLPGLLEAVRIPNHPSREEALSHLESMLGEDYGNDVAKWNQAIQAYLKEQADADADADAEMPD